MAARVDFVLVRRLIRTYDAPGIHDFYRGVGLKRIKKYPPREYRTEVRRSDDSFYDFGRVRYFVDQLLKGRELSPIWVDNVCDYGRIYPEPIVVDGHHRLWAYWMVRRKRIPVHYSGRVDLLEYLKGMRSRLPE